MPHFASYPAAAPSWYRVLTARISSAVAVGGAGIAGAVYAGVHARGPPGRPPRAAPRPDGGMARPATLVRAAVPRAVRRHVHRASRGAPVGDARRPGRDPRGLHR